MEKHQDTGTVQVTASHDAGNMRRMLELVAYNCRIGHSFVVIVDPDDKRRQRFFFDGDGATRVLISQCDKSGGGDEDE